MLIHFGTIAVENNNFISILTIKFNLEMQKTQHNLQTKTKEGVLAVLFLSLKVADGDLSKCMLEYVFFLVAQLRSHVSSFVQEKERLARNG